MHMRACGIGGARLRPRPAAVEVVVVDVGQLAAELRNALRARSPAGGAAFQTLSQKPHRAPRRPARAAFRTLNRKPPAPREHSNPSGGRVPQPLNPKPKQQPRKTLPPSEPGWARQGVQISSPSPAFIEHPL